MNSLDLGIPIGDQKVNVLLYADDVVLLADNESDLQNILDKVSEWGKKWRIKFNNSKSKVVHFRSKQANCTENDFYVCNQVLEKVPSYKYLGLIIEQFLDFNISAEVLASAGSRALGALISKYQI